MVEFEVEATGVADRLPLAIAAPQSGGHRVAVGTGQTRTTVPPDATDAADANATAAALLLPLPLQFPHSNSNMQMSAHLHFISENRINFDWISDGCGDDYRVAAAAALIGYLLSVSI